MNKLLLLSRIKGWMFVLKSSINYNIDFIYHKKASELSFSSRLKTFVLMVSKLAFVFKISRPIVFSGVKKVSFCTVKEIFLDQEIFPQSKKFPWSRSFSTVKEIFIDQWMFPQSKKFSKKNFTWSRRFSTSREDFHSQGNVPQNLFAWSRKFSTKKFYLIKEIFHKQESFPIFQKTI